MSRSETGPVERTHSLRDFLLGISLLAMALALAFQGAGAARQGNASQGIAYSVTALVLAGVIAFALIPKLIRRIVRSHRFPFSFSITREGWIYIVAVFFLSVAAINSGNNLLFVVLASALAAIIASGIVSRGSLRSIAVSVQVPENVFVGEPVSIKVTLWNRKHVFSSFSITVENAGTTPRRAPRFSFRKPRARTAPLPVASILEHPAYFPVIPPKEMQSELVVQSFPRRGIYRLEGFRISTRYPFGLFRRGERIQAKGEVLVYPLVHEVSAYFHLLPFLPGMLEGNYVGPGENLHSIRRYQDGESARIVHWKATAKTGTLMARDYAREEESKFCLILDTIVRPVAASDTEEKFERAVSLAASLAMHFTEKSSELEFLTPEEYIPRGMGPDHLNRILRALAVVQCRAAAQAGATDLRAELSGVLDAAEQQRILSGKVFKIIVTSRPKGGFPSAIWRSSHIVFFDEL
jgi:uncharacterized protein (DUF58 family)